MLLCCIGVSFGTRSDNICHENRSLWELFVVKQLITIVIQSSNMVACAETRLVGYAWLGLEIFSSMTRQ